MFSPLVLLLHGALPTYHHLRSRRVFRGLLIAQATAAAQKQSVLNIPYTVCIATSSRREHRDVCPILCRKSTADAPLKNA